MVNTPLVLWMNTLYPIIVLVLLPFATTMDINSLNTIIIDQDHSRIASELQERFTQSGYFIPIAKGEAISDDDAYKMVEEGKADVIITIPQGLEKGLLLGESKDISVVVDALNATKGALASAYTQLIVTEFRQTLTEQKEPNTTNPVEFRQKTLFNPNANYRSFVIPGLIAIVVSITTLIMPAVSLVQEKESGTIEQLNVTPIKSYMVLLSKALPYWILVVIMMPLYILLVGLIYGLWPHGSFWAMEISTLLVGISFTSVGLIIANYSSRLQQLMLMVIFVMIVMLLMSGVFTPVAGMPEWARVLSHTLPLFYYANDTRTIFLRGGGILDVSYGLIVLSLFSAALSALAFITYRKRSM